MAQQSPNRTTILTRWLEPELFQPFLLGVFLSLTLSEFVRGALTLSVLPTYGKTVLGFAVEWTALALSIHYLTDNLLRAPAGWLIDRVGQRIVLLIGFAIAVISVIWMMHAHSILTLILSLALYGVSVTPMWPAAISGVSMASPEDKRGSFMGYMYMFWMVGTGLGPVLINFVLSGTYRIAFWLLVCVDACAWILTFILVQQKNLLFHPSQTVKQTSISSQPSDHRQKTDWHGLWRNVREVAFLFPGMFAQTFAVASLIPILSLYAHVVLKISGATYSSILVAGGAVTVLMLLPAGRLIDKFGVRFFLVGAFLLAGLILGFYPFYHTLRATYVVVILLGLCYAFILPAWNSVLDKSIDKDKKATLWGVFMTVEGLGSAVGPYLGGLVWDKINPEAPFWVSAIVIFAMGLIYTVMPIDGKKILSRSVAIEQSPVQNKTKTKSKI